MESTALFLAERYWVILNFHRVEEICRLMQPKKAVSTVKQQEKTMLLKALGEKVKA